MPSSANPKRSIIPSTLVLSSLLLLSAGIVQGQIQDRPQVGPEQKKLEVWVG